MNINNIIEEFAKQEFKIMTTEEAISFKKPNGHTEKEKDVLFIEQIPRRPIHKVIERWRKASENAEVQSYLMLNIKLRDYNVSCKGGMIEVEECK